MDHITTRHPVTTKEVAMRHDRAKLNQSREVLIDEVIEIFQPRSPEPLTREDGREIYENLTGFFNTLLAIKRDRDAALAERPE